MSTAATQFERLSLQLESHIARLGLRHPPLNIIDIPMMEELGSALREIESQPGISTVVIRGEGNCFSSGVDVEAHAPDKISSMLQKFHAVIRALISTKKITIAQVSGHCLGGGAELAMVCDLVYTADDARWGFPEIRLGCFPPVAATALAALVGHKQAAELILTGRTIRGIEAAEIGLAVQHVPDDDLNRLVDDTVGTLSRLSSAALALTKKALYAWDSMHFDKGLARAERIYLEELRQTEDAEEGIRAFLEKRGPRWQGR
jgi:cyclohexa-1,5-dienecarbonyl-CoA hydratase